MTASKRAADICWQLYELLSETSPYFAGLARGLGIAAENDLIHAVPIYESLDWWGGSGSLADSAAGDAPKDTKKAVYRLLVELRDEFRAHGIEHDRANFWADTFYWWLKDGILDEEPS